MIEEAIAGMSTINGSWSGNTHTLTTANGSTSESRAAILKLTDTGTTLSGAATLIVPTASKLYLVINEAGQIVTVKTASGTGIAVPSAKICHVFCDGTNVVEGASYSAIFSAGTITASGLNTFASLKGTGSTTVTNILDEDNMASDSATALATQQSIKAYCDTTGFHKATEGTSDFTTSVLGASPPTLAITTTLTQIGEEIVVYGDANTTYQGFRVTPTMTLDKTGTSSYAQQVTVEVTIEKKSKGATGTLLGTVAVAEAQVGGSGSYWRKMYIAGDITDKIDPFTSVATAADGTGATRVYSSWYELSGNRTGLIFSSGSDSADVFTGVGDNVYVSDSSFASTSAWVVAKSAAYWTQNYSFDGTTYLPAVDSSGNAGITHTILDIPEISSRHTTTGSNASTEFRVRINSPAGAGAGTIAFKGMNITKVYNK
jgi:hypothetical protein